jgi:Predicted membrane protein (DUF2142)
VRSLVSWVKPLAAGLRSTPRRVWWTSFVLVALLSGLWAVANPPLAGPDEPAHVIRADALDHGELIGDEPRGRVERDLRRVAESARVVQAPEIYRSVNGPPCFARQQGVAACFNFEGSSRDADVVTYAARQPPAYHAVVGVVSWVAPAGSATVYLMRFLGVLMTAAFIATAITALRRVPARGLPTTGLILALTPMVLFMTSVVNPSSTEIAASIALWVCGIVLLSRAGERIDNRLVTATGIAGCVLALSRQLGPLWIALIALAVVGVTKRAEFRNLARSSWARLWAAFVLVSIAAQVAWVAIVRPRDATLVSRTSRFAVIEVVGDTGSIFRWYREMIGWFGWLDTPAPILTWLPWTAAIAFLFFVALAWVSRCHAAVLLALLVTVIVVPLIVDSTPYDAPGTFWQGRYILPLAVGIPIVAAFTLASTERGRELITGRFVWTVGVIIGVAQFLAFAQNLRRYTVGYDGDIQYWKHPEWQPPLPPLLLTVAYAAAITAFLTWLLVDPYSSAPSASTTPRSEQLIGGR